MRLNLARQPQHARVREFNKDQRHHVFLSAVIALDFYVRLIALQVNEFVDRGPEAILSSFVDFEPLHARLAAALFE